MLFVRIMIGVLLTASLPYTAKAEFPEEVTDARPVLITGASSGIGRVTAERLARQGYLVFAGARKKVDIDALNAIENVQAVRLDVTSDDDVTQALSQIEAAGYGLWGLVNNAGVNHLDPMLEANLDTTRWLFEVNVFGVIRVTQAFAPLLIESGGRVVTISSISGELAGLPGYGNYAMSKHAVEALIDTLAVELGMEGVNSIGIEPGGFSSKIGESRCRRMLAEGREYRYLVDQMREHLEYCRDLIAGDIDRSEWSTPEPVAAAVESALFDKAPHARYLVTSAPFEAQLFNHKIMNDLLQYNAGAVHKYTRDELVEILDERLLILDGKMESDLPF